MQPKRNNKKNKDMKAAIQHRRILLLLVPLALLACKKTPEPEIEIGKYGSSTSVTIGSEAGTQAVTITSDGTWNANLTYSTRTWASIEGPAEGSGNGSVTVKYKANDGLPRQGVLLVSSPSKATIDTVYLKQYGMEPQCDLLSDTLRFSCVAGADSTLLDTNIPISEAERFQVDVNYQSGEDWLTPVLRDNLERLAIQVSENTKFQERTAVVTVSFTDDWGRPVTASTVVVQGIPGGTESTQLKTFADVRALLSSDGEMVIEDDISIEGWIISDREGGNMGDCPENILSYADWSPNDRTAFIENDDASLGFRLITTSLETNQTARYAKTKIWLKGLTLTREGEPVRYTISGIGKEHYISSVQGTPEDIPAKNRYIRDLKDEDIYTQVTLKKCEYPIRRGALVMVNTGYNGRETKNVNILADIHGDWIYQIFNLKCDFLFSKEGAPKGQGKVTGILVHEKSQRVNPVEPYDMSRYQLRSASREDIAISQSANDSFTSIITEWADNASDGKARRVHPNATIDINGDLPASFWGIEPTYGRGFFYHCKGLWPVITGAYCRPDTGGALSNAVYGFNTWWDAAAGAPNYAIWKFSTKGISSGLVTLCFTARNHSQTSPPIWAIEYSKDGGETWTRIGEEFYVPPTATWSPNTPLYQIAGEKPNYFVIPNDILDLDVAMVRMIPSRDFIGSASGWNNGGPLSKNNGYLDLCYSAIRYKK